MSKPNTLDDLICAIDWYATKCAHRQRHMPTALKPAAKIYAELTGITKSAAEKHLTKLLCC